MTVNPMIERVARALFENTYKRPTEEKWQETHRVYEHDARAAIVAMREPIEAMCDEAGGFPLDEHQAADLWRAMIDAALKK